MQENRGSAVTTALQWEMPGCDFSFQLEQIQMLYCSIVLPMRSCPGRIHKKAKLT